MDKLLLPINESSPVGEDPRYSDNFVALKSEIEKKDGVEFEKISTLATGILISEAKDLRVSSFLALAYSRLRGIVGLFDGLNLILDLITTFPDEIFPTKVKIRKTSILWLHQPKTLVFAKKEKCNLSFEDVEKYSEDYTRYCEKVSEYLGEGITWPDLKKWLDDLKKDLKPKEVSKVSEPSASESTRPPGNVASGSGPSAPTSSNISSAGQFQQQQRLLIRYCKEQKQFGKAAALTRALLYGEFKLPPNEAGKTRVPPPNSASVSRIKNFIDSEQWHEGFIAAEDSLLENGSLFLFEIQKLSFECAMKTGMADVANQIKNAFVQLLDRYPKLSQLTFDNGELFMNGSVTSWLDSLRETNEGSGQADSGGYRELLNEARKNVMESSLKETIAWIQDQPSRNSLSKSYQVLVSAQVCVENERNDLALPLLTSLDKIIELHQLNDYLPDFCMQVWKNLYLIAKTELVSSEGDDLNVVEMKIERFRSLLCNTDISKAMEWI